LTGGIGDGDGLALSADGTDSRAELGDGGLSARACTDGDGLALSADGTDSLSVTRLSVVGCAAEDSFAARASRLTPAIEAHRLTQLCATSCFFAAAFTPDRRASETTPARCSAVYLRLVLLDSIPTSDRLRPRPVYVRDLHADHGSVRWSTSARKHNRLLLPQSAGKTREKCAEDGRGRELEVPPQRLVALPLLRRDRRQPDEQAAVGEVGPTRDVVDAVQDDRADEIENLLFDIRVKRTRCESAARRDAAFSGALRLIQSRRFSRSTSGRSQTPRAAGS